jgi:hypothetical protein
MNMELLRKFLFTSRTPNEIRQVLIESDPGAVALIAEVVAAAKEQMGERWVLHPSNMVQKVQKKP